MWVNIDDLAGKGFTIIDFLRLLSYFSITVIPMSLPISILISSVFVFGSLSEKYELSGIKSAGISLINILKPGIIIAIITLSFSLFVSNYLKPKSMLKFLTVFTSIKKKKPTLNIQEKIFNNDFNGYSIQVNSKSKDNRNIQGIKIYNVINILTENYNITTAKRGEIFTSKNGKYFIMKLFDGNQYIEQVKKNTKLKTTSNFPLRRTHFDTLEKAFDLSYFNKHVEGLFSSKRKDMLNTSQLLDEIERLNSKIEENKFNISESFSKLLKAPNDTLHNIILNENNSKSFIESLKHQKTAELLSSINELINFEKNRLNNSYLRIQSLLKQKEYLTLGLHQQYVLALICIIFLFIGAPLGSIIRKGGYGLPILVAILFFTIFILLSISGEKLNKSQIFNPVFNAWLPVLVLLPISIVLTIKALFDSKSLGFSDQKTIIYKKNKNKKAK